MLHFLLGTALCLFIGERLVRYWSAWRRRRDERRYLAMLYPPPLKPERPSRAPRHPWYQTKWGSRIGFATFCILWGVVILAAFHVI
jgi:hypothetical protein